MGRNYGWTLILANWRLDFWWNSWVPPIPSNYCMLQNRSPTTYMYIETIFLPVRTCNTIFLLNHLLRVIHIFLPPASWHLTPLGINFIWWGNRNTAIGHHVSLFINIVRPAELLCTFSHIVRHCLWRFSLTLFNLSHEEWHIIQV